MMRFLQGTFFRIGGIAYQDFDDFPQGQIPATLSFGTGAVVTAGMSIGKQTFFTRAYVPPPPRELYVASDDFHRLPDPPGNGPLGGNWDFPFRGGVDFTHPQVINNAVEEGAENVDCCAFWKGDGTLTWEVDQYGDIAGQYAQIVIQTPLPTTAGNYAAVLLRCERSSGTKFYLAGIFASATAGVVDCKLFYWNGASLFVSMGVVSGAAQPWVAGDTLRCEVTGDDTPGNPCFVTVLHNGRMILRKQSFGASLKLGGAPGLAIFGSFGDFWLDNWSAGELNPVDRVFHFENWESKPDGPLGNPWAFPFALPNRPHVISHHVEAIGYDGYDAAYWVPPTGVNFSTNHYSQALVPTVPSAFPGAVGMICRAGGGQDAFYAGMIHGPNDYRIWLYWNDGTHPPGHGIWTQVAGGAGGPFTIIGNRVLRCDVVGNVTPVFNMYHDGVLILSHKFTDANTEVRIGGYPGFVIWDPAGAPILTLDNWEGGKV